MLLVCQRSGFLLTRITHADYFARSSVKHSVVLNSYTLRYKGPALQRQHLFPKMLPLKWNCCRKESLNAAEWYVTKCLFYIYFLREHMFWYLLESPHRGDSIKYPKYTFLEVFNTIFLHYFWLTGTSWAKVSCQLTLVLLNPDMSCLCKQCRSRSVGFWRSQLIWICTVCH